MKFSLRFLLFLLGLLLLAHGTLAQQTETRNTALEMVETLPLDPQIKTGTLPNGLRYFIRQNQEPEKRAELRLVVNAGSILENEDQLGLAHFVEHMAFNGTQRFEKQALVDYLESIGTRFGPDLNAYTSFDETVYMLQIPTDTLEIVETGFAILGEWAQHISFEDEEIDKERGVVIEEWRLGRGAQGRMQDKILPVLFHGSRYADRLPIGTKENLESFPYETARQFYRDWYRPDLMAVVVVGDLDVAQAEALIQQNFGDMPIATNPRPREAYTIPGHEETLYAIATDPEMPQTAVGVMYKMDAQETGTVGAYRQGMVEALFAQMFNARLQELTTKPDAPFLFGIGVKGGFSRAVDVFQLIAAVQETGVERGLQALLTEAERVAQFGFTKTELERQKKELLRFMEQGYAERENIPSAQFAAEYIRHFLVGEPVPGIEMEYQLYQTYLPTITVEEVNQLVGQWMTKENRVIMLQGPEKEGLVFPTETALADVLESVAGQPLEAYKDVVSESPLLAELPTPGEVVDVKKNRIIGVETWTLSNDVRVILKQTDFKEDEVVFSAYSPGGHSLADDPQFTSASMATSVITESGLADFDQTALQKMLAGQVVSVYPYISSMSEGLNGSASPQDLETLFQLIHLYFTAARADETAFMAFKQRLNGMLENMSATPTAVFSDTVSTTMSQNHWRSRPMSQELLNEIDMNEALTFYQDRFADASDFTFTFVGNFEMDRMKTLAETYLATLPDLDREETGRDIGLRAPEGVIRKEVRRGIDPQSQVRLIFTGDFVWNAENRALLGAMSNILETKLRETLREDLGGTYGVGVSASTIKNPVETYRLTIQFGCDPARVEELMTALFTEIEAMKTEGVEAKYLESYQEKQRRQHEISLQENRYWLNTLTFADRYNLDPRASILKRNEQLDALTLESIQAAAQHYVNMAQYAQFILKPEHQ